MNPKSGEIVSVSHYSKVNPFKSILIDVSYDSLVLKLTKDFIEYNFLENDPIVLGYEVNSEIYICECLIEEIYPKNSTVKLKIDNIQLVANQRLFERFPVSFYAHIRFKNSRKRNIAFVKNLSLSGMSVISKADISEDKEVIVDLYIDDIIITLESETVFRIENNHGFEYGLKVNYSDLGIKNFIASYLHFLKDEQKQALK
ncbi:MAG: PilZ domain-containing protein [Clostridia bacterium]|nr:PilZ domain-containing protein [Clostridia bacterium]